MPDFDPWPLLEVLLTSLSLFAMGWWPCAACGGDTSCAYCGSGNAPAELEITISGITNLDCYDCEQLNDTYVLSYTGFGGDGCCWQFSFGETCSVNTLTACLQYPIALGYQMLVSMHRDDGQGTVVIVWQTIVGDYSPDCDQWDSLDVPVTFQIQTECDDAYSTCTVSSL